MRGGGGPGPRHHTPLTAERSAGEASPRPLDGRVPHDALRSSAPALRGGDRPSAALPARFPAQTPGAAPPRSAPQRPAPPLSRAGLGLAQGTSRPGGSSAVAGAAESVGSMATRRRGAAVSGVAGSVVTASAVSAGSVSVTRTRLP